jgi:thioredoxin 1
VPSNANHPPSGPPARPAPAGRSRLWRLAVLGAVVVAVALILIVKSRETTGQVQNAPGQVLAPRAVSAHAGAAAVTAARLPRLVDLGADRCIPCKAMAPILAVLRTENAGRLDVQFIDVWKDPSAGEPYRVFAIPTQIFYAPSGEELFRHEGFFSKEDILAAWKRLGYEFGATPPRE